MEYSFTSELWQYPGQAAWHFITLPKDDSEDIKALTRDYRRGFGSVKVSVKIGAQHFMTSIFPDSKSGCYMLPVKKSVRSQEHLNAGDKVAVRLTIEL